MALGFGRGKDEDVVALIGAKKYGRAIEVLKAQLQKRGPNPTLRMQLADVLILAGKTSEAAALLLPLADQYARDGFAAKAISVLKKVQKVDPSRRDVEGRLARLIEEKQREAVVLPPAGSRIEIGIEEIGMEPPPGGPLISAPAAARPPAPAPAPEAPPPREALDIGIEPIAPISIPVDPRASSLAPAPPAAPASAGTTSEIEDYDLVFHADDEEDEVLDVEVEVVDEAAASEAEPMSDGRFADELMSLVDSVFQETSTAPRGPAPASGSPPGGAQIVVSPLFRNFSVDEMVAVIHGLKLLSFQRGDVIIRQGQPGASLFMLTSGRVRAFRKDPASGHQQRLGDLKEGAFFGEVSILTGKPRMASIVALTRCELLELDRPTLDEITRTQPHVWDVLREFAEARARSAPS